MTPRNTHNFFLFSGGPGAGKTTLIAALNARGLKTVPEVARNIIRHQRATGGNATHDGDRVLYTELMLRQSIIDYEHLQHGTETVFFDRGLPDLYSYTESYCGGVTAPVREAIAQYRYNPAAFVFPPWEAIYCHDSERRQSFEEAVATWESVCSAYEACGYQVIHVPEATVEARLDFVLERVQAFSKQA